MIFRINDRLSVQFKFHYSLGKSIKTEYSWKRPRITTVEYRIADSENSLVIAANAVCNLKDNFSKDKGRKIALQRLFKVLKRTISDSDDIRWIDNKEIRKRFWNEYLIWTNSKVIRTVKKSMLSKKDRKIWKGGE